MAEPFDPYYMWLGIRDPERPPNHYRLLGLEHFEDHADVIALAADRQMAHLRTFQAGPRGALSQRLLNEIAAARVCLLNANRKAEYDAWLCAQLEAAMPAIEPPPAPPVVPNFAEPVYEEPLTYGADPSVDARDALSAEFAAADAPYEADVAYNPAAEYPAEAPYETEVHDGHAVPLDFSEPAEPPLEFNVGDDLPEPPAPSVFEFTAPQAPEPEPVAAYVPPPQPIAPEPIDLFAAPAPAETDTLSTKSFRRPRRRNNRQDANATMWLVMLALLGALVILIAIGSQ